MLVTKAFPGRCCGVADISERLFKAPEAVVILISNLHLLKWRDMALLGWRDMLSKYTA